MGQIKIISRRHVDRRPVLSTVDRRPSPVDHTQRRACAQHDDDWV